MDTLDLGKVHSGIDVCDARGNKIGTVAHVYRKAGASGAEASAAAARPHQEVVEVKTGPLGLGKHLYIPLGAIDDLNDAGDCLALTVGKQDLDPTWQARPADLGEPMG